MITKRIKEENDGEVGKRKTSGGSQVIRTPNKSKFPTTFREVEHALRSPGYLLPHDLVSNSFN